MAKGNDGNYLQHSLEVAAAVQLATTDDRRRLRVAFGHGMAPFEVCEESRAGQAKSLFERFLNLSYQPARVGEPPIVSAYRATGATTSRYPNSAELLRRSIGVEKLSGGITEVDLSKYEQLESAWKGTQVLPKHSSWRAQLQAEGVLSCPQESDIPWLFTLDPMTYREDGAADDNNLYRADLPILSDALNYFAESCTRGMAAVFVYAIRPETRSLFWQFADDLAEQTGTGVMSFWVTHQGGNRNLAALFCSRFEFEAKYAPAGLVVGRD
jgi:hypothetical protein